MQMVGRAPERGQSGAYLNKASTPGGKVNFISETNLAAGGVFVPQSGGAAVVIVNTTLYDTTLPDSARTDENVISWGDSILWPYFTFFEDFEGDYLYQIPHGANATGTIEYSIHQLLVPSAGKSHTTMIQFTNNASIDHIVYVWAGGKYVLTE